MSVVCPCERGSFLLFCGAQGYYHVHRLHELIIFLSWISPDLQSILNCKSLFSRKSRASSLKIAVGKKCFCFRLFFFFFCSEVPSFKGYALPCSISKSNTHKQPDREQIWKGSLFFSFSSTNPTTPINCISRGQILVYPREMISLYVVLVGEATSSDTI